MIKARYIVLLVTAAMCLSACESQIDRSQHKIQNENSNDELSIVAEVSVEENEDDYSIITRVGHPAYYGSVEESHEIWDDVENKSMQ